MRSRVLVAVILGAAAVAGLLLVGIVILHVAVTVLTDATSAAPGSGSDVQPATSYEHQITKTLATFDSGDRSTFDALYRRSTIQNRDAVWAACSNISPNGRTLDWPDPAIPNEVAVPLAGTSKSHPDVRVSCVFILDASHTDGWWDIHAWAPRGTPTPGTRG